MGSEGIPIGVMREMGMPTLLAACMMMAEQWELLRAEGKAGVVADRVGERAKKRVSVEEQVMEKRWSHWTRDDMSVGSRTKLN